MKTAAHQIHPPQHYYHFTLFMVINEPSPWRPQPGIICLDIWLPGVCVSVSLHKFILQGVICMWQVGIKRVNGGAGDGSSETRCS